MPPQAFDEGVVAHPETEQDPLRKRLGESFHRSGHGDGIAGVDARDPGGPHQPSGCREQQSQVQHDVAAGDLRQPDGAIAEFLELSGELLGFGCGRDVEGPGPDADGGEGKVRFLCHASHRMAADPWAPTPTRDRGAARSRSAPAAGALWCPPCE
jgi:hypothetical protein